MLTIKQSCMRMLVGDWQAVEGVLSKVMATVSEYFQTWKLAQHTKRCRHLADFHLKNKEAKCELNVNHNNETLSPPTPNPSIPGQRWTGRSRIADTTSQFAKS